MPSLPYLKQFWCPRFEKALAINHRLKILGGYKLDIPGPVPYKVYQTDKPI